MSRLGGGGDAVCRVAWEQVIALVQDVDRLARSILVVLVGEESDVVQVDVRKAAFEGHAVAIGQQHMLIHPALFDAPLAPPPDAQQIQRIAAAVLDPATHEDVLAP